MTTDKIIEIVATNAVSWFIVAATFSYTELIPSADRIVEWIVGLVVAMSIICFNIIRARHYWIQIGAIKKKPRKKP